MCSCECIGIVFLQTSARRYLPAVQSTKEYTQWTYQSCSYTQVLQRGNHVHIKMASVMYDSALHPLHPWTSGQPRVNESEIIVTIVCCSLSIIGSLFIILSFCCIKDLRNKIRSFVVFISLMDFTYSVANLVGASINFDKYMKETSYGGYIFAPPTVLESVCIVQGSFAAYGTLGSFLWTACMAVYLYFNVICHLKGKYSKMLGGIYWCGHAVCWTVPLYIVVWSLVDHDVTYSPFLSFGGWCTPFGYRDFSWRGIKYAILVYNDYWIFLVSLMILLFCLATSVIIYAEVCVCARVCIRTCV